MVVNNGFKVIKQSIVTQTYAINSTLLSTVKLILIISFQNRKRSNNLLVCSIFE